MAALIYWYMGLIIQAVIIYAAARIVKRRGCYVAREERMARQIENNVIIFQACCAWLKDERQRGTPPRRSPPGGLPRPVLPPDSMPDDNERSVA